MVNFSLEMISIKSVFITTLSFINSLDALFGLQSFKKCRQFCCTGLLRSNKLVHVDAKNMARFTQNLVQNLMSLLLASRTNRK